MLGDGRKLGPIPGLQLFLSLPLTYGQLLNVGEGQVNVLKTAVND